MRNKAFFQIKCEEYLLTRLGQINLDFDSWDYIDGKNESYYLGEINGVKIWIYEDGVCIKSAKKTYILEELDYKTEDQLIKEAMETFLKLLK